VGTTTMNLPVIGDVNFYLGSVTLPIIGSVGLNLYLLFLLPLGVIACSNLVNILAGFNGLEAGQGIIISAFLILLLTFSGLSINKITMIFLLFALIGGLCAFLIFNWYPAQVFPGNIVTYLIGAIIAAVVIVGNIEKAGIILMLPQIIEFFLKARSHFKAQNFGKCIKGKLNYEGKIYSITHVIMKYLKPTEVQLVAILYLVQILAGLLAIASIML
jgi:UDP-N-acetylglucosamine--dolichyl-phosphate N-acetylglucosaminephosphotransferase